MPTSACRAAPPCAGVLICPVCALPLSAAPRALRCARGHAFDEARDGHVDLLPAGHGRSRLRGDAPEMLHARRRFLDRGHYAPLAALVEAHVARHAARRAARDTARREVPSRFTIVDAGCGEGHLLGRLARSAPLARAAGDACLVGVDLSTAAVRLAARRHRGVRFLVNDVHHRLCVADASADVLLNVFAPRDAAEFARVVRPGGLLLVVVPHDAHLRELRAELPLLGIAPRKRARLCRQLGGAFRLEGEDALTYRVRLTGRDVADLVRMTPSRWHVDAAALARAAAAPARHVTASFVALRFRRRGGASDGV